MLLSDSKSLLQGRISVEDEIKRNVDAFLSSRSALKWGILAHIIVKTGTGRRLYPSSDQDTLYLFDSKMFPRGNQFPISTDMLHLAENNLKIMDEGINLSLTVQIPRNTWLANGLLAFYIMVFTFFLFRAYKSSAREARRIQISTQQVLGSANKKLMAAQQRLQEVKIREENYQKEIKQLKNDLELASVRMRKTEDEALAEMEQLEMRLGESIALKEQLELEVLRLEEELEGLEATQKITYKKRQKQVNTTMKRFKTLYKNLYVQQRAVEGFLDLESDLQLRAEELIHNMNEDSSQLPVKRKIFSKKGATPTFECEFGYKGRIYWRPDGDKIQVLVIGTKNSQAKDLAYLQSL